MKTARITNRHYACKTQHLMINTQGEDIRTSPEDNASFNTFMSHSWNITQLASTDRSCSCPAWVYLTKNRVELVPWSMAATRGPSIIRCEDAAMVLFMGSPGPLAQNWIRNRLPPPAKRLKLNQRRAVGQSRISDVMLLLALSDDATSRRFSTSVQFGH